MRYQNWDVLIFPLVGETKTPLQEFGTGCTVNQDPGKDKPSLHSPTIADPLNIRCRAFSKSFSTSGLLDRRENPLADCHMLHPQYPPGLPIPCVVAQLVHANSQP